MCDIERINKALNLNELKLPQSPRIVKLDWDFYEDSSGEDSLKIWVILDDETQDSEIQGPAIRAIKTEIMNRLRGEQVSLFPYFFFVLEREHQASVEPD